jgi:hypothetical protein
MVISENSFNSAHIRHNSYNAKELIDICTKKSVSDYHNKGDHISFGIRDYLQEINNIICTFGVESLHPEIDIQYCNTGDMYAITIYYYNNKLRIGDIGTILETL